ncbi:MAG: hypothetical protein IPG66_08670 [Hydrogenophilales bacterium]|nr:hypothetical protein [Hydrogenophilales bacterium]
MARQLISILLICTSIGVHAEPSRTVMYLINQPMSMWQFGLYQLDNHLKDISFFQNDKLTKIKLSAHALYNPVINRILIHVMPPFDGSNKPNLVFEAESVAESKEYCKDMIRSVRFQLGNHKTLSEKTSWNSFMCGYFTDDNLKNAQEPSNICNELDSLVEIRAWIGIKGGETIHCNGALVSGSIYFSQ